MAKPKDYIVYIEKGTNETKAVMNYATKQDLTWYVEEEGHKIIGYVSSGSMKEAIAYADQVLR
jgi:hypothetical protein